MSMARKKIQLFYYCMVRLRLILFVIKIGHSLGGQLAVMLVCERPERFSFAVFLSAWVNPNPKTIGMYCSLAGVTTKIRYCSKCRSSGEVPVMGIQRRGGMD